MGGFFSEPKAATTTAVSAPAPVQAATLVTEPPKKAGDRGLQKKRGSRAASILTTDIEDARLGG